MKIKYKLAGIILLIVSLILINLIMIFSLLNLAKDDSLLVNLSGRQRMLTQKISKNVFLLSLTYTDYCNYIDRNKVLEELNGAVKLYDQTILAFLNGGDIVNGEGAAGTIEDIGSDKDVAQLAYDLWVKFKASTEKVIATGDPEATKFIYENNLKLLKLSNDVVTALQAKADLKMAFMKNFQYLVLLLSIVILVVTYFLLNKIITKPLLTVRESMEKGKKGDLTAKIDIDTNDEIGDMARDYNALLDSLKNLINSVMESISHARMVSSNLASASEESSAALEEISITITNMKNKTVKLDDELLDLNNGVAKIDESISDVSTQINQQNELIAESSSAVEEMDSSIKNVANITETKMSIINDLNAIANDGEKEMFATIDVISEISNFTNNIMEFLDVINNIASQTNLLAMNAAIEAAHAGEAGKGFAVVADEIRKLAEDTGNNAKEISVTLKKVIENIEKSGDSSKKTGEYFRKIVNEISDVSNAMREIKIAMDELSLGSSQLTGSLLTLKDSSHKVDDSTREMVRRSEKINTSLSLVEKISTETKTGMEEVTYGVNELFKSVQLIAEAGAENSESVRNIEDSIEEFTI